MPDLDHLAGGGRYPNPEGPPPVRLPRPGAEAERPVRLGSNRVGKYVTQVLYRGCAAERHQANPGAWWPLPHTANLPSGEHLTQPAPIDPVSVAAPVEVSKVNGPRLN